MDATTELTPFPEGAQPVVVRCGNVRLHGLLREAEGHAAVAILHVHGRGANFYTRPGTAIMSRFPASDVAHLTVNLRSHDLAYTDVPERGPDPGAQEAYQVAGAMWEHAPDSAADIGVAVGALHERGYDRVFVAAHSAGALVLAAYAATNHHLAGRILLSPLTGSRGSLLRWFGDEDGVQRAAARARRLVADGRGHLLIAVPSWYYAISAATLLERLGEADQDWRRDVEADTSPCLMVWGGGESRAPLWRRTYEALDLPDKRGVEIAGSGHYYVGFDDQVAAAVAEFVDAHRSGDRSVNG